MTRPDRLPITIKVPLFVALLMLLLSAVLSERVLSRLVATQEEHLRNLSAAYLDGLSSSLVPHVLREDVWEVFDILDRSLALYETARPVETVVVSRTGHVIAATDPIRYPALEPLAAPFAPAAGAAPVGIDEARGEAFVHRVLQYQGTEIGAVHAVLDVRHLLEERTDVVIALVATNGALTLLLAFAGYLVVRRMVAPVRTLTDHLTASADGRAAPIADADMPVEGSEARRLFDAYNRLVEAERERTELALRLAEEERLASLGRLASGMAHEINNPLGGLFNALDTVRRHGHVEPVRASAVGLLERGLTGIRNVVAAALQTYRPERTPRAFGPADVEDVTILVTPEARRRCLAIEWRSGIVGPLPLPSHPLRQAVLNLVLNACAASPDGGRVVVSLIAEDGMLEVVVADEGPGLPGWAVALLSDPDPPAPIGRSGGLGLWMVRRAVTEAGGTLECGTGASGGACVTVRVPLAARVAEEQEADAVA